MNVSILRNTDYEELLDSLAPESVDFICIDPPYGKINNLLLDGQKEAVNGDVTIDGEVMFKKLNRVLKKGGTICAFGQNPTYAKMICANIKDYKYELIGLKNNSAQGFHADKMPLNLTENIAVFIKSANTHQRTFNVIKTPKTVDKDIHFTRGYSQQLQLFINKSRRQLHSDLGHRKAEFGFYFTGKNFGIISEPIYNQLIELYNINTGEHFIPYQELKAKGAQEKNNPREVFNSEEYSSCMKNVLMFSKDNVSLHPTQKPLALIEHLIATYSNEGDTVLDCFFGSGTTAVAAGNLKRNFIGSELKETYYLSAGNRLEQAKKESK